MPQLKSQVAMRPFHKSPINTFFTIWSTRNVNQATIIQSASDCRRQTASKCLSAGRWHTLPREALPSSVTPPFPQRHAGHPASPERDKTLSSSRKAPWLCLQMTFNILHEIHWASEMKSDDHRLTKHFLYCAHRLVQCIPSFFQCYHITAFSNAGLPSSMVRSKHLTPRNSW